MAISDYASRKDRRLTPYRRRLASAYQRAFLDLCRWSARKRELSPREVLEAIAPAAAQRNPRARMTGDGLTHATRRLTTNRGRLAPEETYRLVQAFVDSQRLETVPADRRSGGRSNGQRAAAAPPDPSRHAPDRRRVPREPLEPAPSAPPPRTHPHPPDRVPASKSRRIAPRGDMHHGISCASDG